MRGRVALVLLLAARACAQNASEACLQAIEAQEWVLEQYTSTDPQMAELLLEGMESIAPRPFQDVGSWFDKQTSWSNYNFQALLSSAPWGGADYGEVQYVASQINAAWANVTAEDATVENVYGAWSEAMVAQGDRLAALARDPATAWLPSYRAGALFRAMNFYVMSFWPYPAALGVEEQLGKGQEAFEEYLGLAGLDSTAFEVPFNTGTVTTSLSAEFITPDPSRALPVIVFILGTDTPKEAMYSWYGPPLVQQNYSLLIFDGPGQGSTPYKPEHMPFYAKARLKLSSPPCCASPGMIHWLAFRRAAPARLPSEEYTRKVVDTALANPDVGPKMDAGRMALLGYSFGGFLGGRACSMMGDVFKACVLTPPVASMAANYEKILGRELYAPFQYVLKANASLVPDQIQPLLEDPIARILRPLVLECPPDSPAPDLFNIPLEMAQSPLDPELVYSAVGYAGQTSADPADVVDAQWAAYRNTFTNFSNPLCCKLVLALPDFKPTQAQANATSVPVWGVQGTEDDLIGGLEKVYWDQLPEATKAKSRFVSYAPDTGAALHCQNGALTIFFADLLPWLAPLLKPAPAPAPAGEAAPGPSP
ncbi:hypothetical protein CHLNCDRAFT_51708 [Chlorella variabilis]|uniref:AB hydrolase-1 domain-containing protein n=1 Tax=Chlorella variabilis TaxID=554065 RepID=E1ZBS4_CHLVA|nr:hypothetical protein CHLNCDRAFT_51708 [Chlorella variabilis]EFN56911.1 hypothetical protein CHLNCDRAFT_51708 [Chlorella variabilis]|eukprot:XP_005849013.1 hypothetical protein CHLNCDRAFT_51708 [Chlorella variabilis]